MKRMKYRTSINIGSALLAAATMLSTFTAGQQRDAVVSSRPTAYDQTREIRLQGTVVSYTEDSSRPPMGARVAVQTANGTIDVHLGPSAYLRGNHFSLAVGDSVRFMGVSIPTKDGNLFLARIAENGKQVITLRSASGFLLAPGAGRTLPHGEAAQGAQRKAPR